MAGHLITGGARSGKTAFAEKLARDSGLPTVYIATAAVGDAEMAERVARHRKARPASWRTVEVNEHIAAVLEEESKARICIILDCITLWLARMLTSGPQSGAPSPGRMSELDAERHRLIGAIAESAAEIIIVTNELGSGVTPMGQLSRAFVDEHGLTNQRIAEICDRVTLLVAGCALNVKPGASHQAS